MNIMMNLLLIDPISFLIYPAVYLLLFQAVASPDQTSQKKKQKKKRTGLFLCSMAHFSWYLTIKIECMQSFLTYQPVVKWTVFKF